MANKTGDLLRQNGDIVRQASTYYDRINSKLDTCEIWIRESGCLAPVSLKLDDDLTVGIVKVGGVWRITIDDGKSVMPAADCPVHDRIRVILVFDQLLQALISSNAKVVEQLAQATASI